MPPRAEPTRPRRVAAAAVAVPAEPDELTPTWLTAALAQGGRSPGAIVTAVTAVPVGQDTGFLGRLLRLRLSYAPTGPAGPPTLVAKLPTTDPGGRAVGMMLSVWPREARFYADIASHLGPAVPTCHYNGADPAAGRWALLLDDLGDPVGVDQLAGATDAQAHAAIDTLAALHRRWWDARPVDWLPGFDRPAFGGLQSAMYDAVPAFIQRYGDVVAPAAVAGLVAFIDALPAWAAQQAAGPLTLAHADYRLDNLLFPSATPGHAVVLDWQTALWGPGALDLSCFCASSLTVVDRRRLEADLLDRYVAGLAGADGGPKVDGEVVLAGYRSALWWWLAIFANNLTRIDTAPGRTRDLFEQVIVRTATAVADHHPDGYPGPATG